MDDEKTLLQQIRDKEQEFGVEVEAARAQAEARVAAARSEAEDLLCTADIEGKKDAEQVYWKDKAKTETEIEALKKAAEQELAGTLARAEKNIPAAADRIVRYATME